MWSGIDNPARWVLPAVLAEQAAVRPDAVWFSTTDGEALTWRQAAEDVDRAAGFLASLGVARGDRVAVFLPNGTAFLRAWLGLGRLGATAVLLNTELRGAFLRHQLVNSEVELAVVDETLLPAMLAVADEAPQLRRIAIVGRGPEAGIGRLEAIDWAGWRAAAPFTGGYPKGHEIACIMYTSGTSGPAKGVLMPHAHCALYGIGAAEAIGLSPDDRYYITLPLFHANGLLMQLAATMIAGMPAVVRGKFSASAWLEDVRRHDITVTNSLGAVAAYIVAQPPTPRDRDHRLRAILSAPNLPEHEAAFRDRFGVRDVISGFGMTEVNIPVWGRVGHRLKGAGWVYRKHFDVVVADPETDAPLPPGQVGEILVRPKTPWGFMQGYYRMPKETVEAWRNLWFHTGDAGTLDEQDVLTFVDRLKDRIRRRGENISASEVEAAIGKFPGISELAVYAVPSDIPGGEDELMVAVVARQGEVIDLAALAGFADEVVPRFARPRYFEIVESLPKTATDKVQRAVLRKRGMAGAWDREGGKR
ncbi:MAG: AMP-binding protein [Gemmatimonadetes bacterium]|nr:AMP-binding protein [Gemmatimonadota bacterium]